VTGHTATVQSFSVRLPGLASSVTRGRHLLTDYLCKVGYGDSYDVRLGVTEALTNAVRHAYRAEAKGDIELEAVVQDAELHVIIRDFGTGPTVQVSSAGVGLGLPLMASVARRVVIDVEAGRGTEVHLTFAS
jgi:anti-sigma regulatory factor (Ser/Thr protein kinase)